MKTEAQKRRMREVTRKWFDTAKGQNWRQRGPDRDRARRKRIRALLHEHKRVPCADCGGTFDPVCMDFDHRPGETKAFGVAQISKTNNIELIKAEIAKCDVVCANCHRLRTHRRRVEGVK